MAWGIQDTRGDLELIGKNHTERGGTGLAPDWTWKLDSINYWV
jgi:hypothetical protein